MKTKIYTRFASLLQSGLYCSYEQICRVLRVSPDSMDEFLLSELGYTGAALLDSFGNQRENY